MRRMRSCYFIRARGRVRRSLKPIALATLCSALSCTAALARDGFEAVRCGSDIPAALMGKVLPSETIAGIEGRHRDLGLKNLGADEISDRLNAASWQICGKEYLLLTDAGDVVRDLLLLPPHSTAAPEFDGIGCERNGAKVSAVVVAVLHADGKPVAGHYAAEDRTLVPAASAWKIDEAREKFVPLSGRGLRCPRGGIITADGGP